jgi:Terminase large subunit, T4likevirus-type, N-terminal
VKERREPVAVRSLTSFRKAMSSFEPVTTVGEPIDGAKYAWYERTCPCGLPAGECKEHPRARESQMPPAGEWTRWFLMAGRGFGKTKAGAEWVRHLAENKLASRIALVGPTAADVRDVMVEGVSGIVAVSRPDFRPRYAPSLGRVTWPNGVIATCFSADEPDRLRGPQHDHAWIDEPGAWRYGREAFDMLMFGLRLGEHPRVCVTTTPRATELIKTLAADPKTHLTRGTTYDNRVHLAPAFFSEIISKYEGTRLGEQELNAQLLEITEGAWFPMFSVARHVSTEAEFHPAFTIRVAIDAGTSRHTGAVLFQLRPHHSGWSKVTVFGDYHGVDVVSAENAMAIRDRCMSLAQRGPDLVRLDPAASARTSIGPAAFNEYARVFGERITDRWPSHGVVDGLDQIELMLGGADEPKIVIHPRCTQLVQAFQTYRRAERGGEYLDTPVDPQHPAEDLLDALRGGIRDSLPDGRKPPPNLRTVSARHFF